MLQVCQGVEEQVRLCAGGDHHLPRVNRHSPLPAGRECYLLSQRAVKVDAGVGIFWFIGWLFTIAFAQLVWWQAILGLLVWPYYLGLAVR
jgi:hypothetical protein